MSSVLDEVGNYLEGQGLVSGSTGWALSKGIMPESPDKVVAVFDLPGGDPDESEGTQYDVPGFQIRVRGSIHGYEAARVKIQAVFESLQNSTPTNFIYVFAVQSSPLPFGYDKNERPELTWNFEGMRERTT